MVRIDHVFLTVGLERLTFDGQKKLLDTCKKNYKKILFSIFIHNLYYFEVSYLAVGMRSYITNNSGI